MIKITRRICILALAFILIIVSFNFFQTPNLNTLADTPCTITGVSFHEKVLQDIPMDEDVKKEGKIVLDVARAEVECAQIVLTPSEDVNFTVELDDLYSASGSKYSKENVELSIAMYSKIVALTNGKVRNMPCPAMYPDGMLPYDRAVYYEYNRVKKDNNQSIYFDFTIPENQEVGLYTGNFKVIINGQTTSVPVSLNVRNLTVSTALLSKTRVGLDWAYFIGEYEYSQNMLEEYQKALIKYRVNAANLVVDNNDSVLFANTVKEMYEYGSNEELWGSGADRFTCYALPVESNSANGLAESMKEKLTEIIKVCCEKKVDLVERAHIKYVDEPSANGLDGADVKKKTDIYIEGKEIAKTYFMNNKQMFVDYFDGTSSEYDVFMDEIIESIGNIHNLVTESYSEEYAGAIETWVPFFNSYDTEAQVEKYKEEDPDERWWYGCNKPTAPYPSYEMDDFGYTPRILGWLQSYYGVTGNLYWGCDAYVSVTDGFMTEDIYDKTTTIFSNTLGFNGEGILFRPGKKFGVEGPIPTIRIVSVRDGEEDFELFESLKKIYSSIENQAGVECNTNNIVKNKLDKITNGMKIFGDSNQFDSLRQEMLDLFEFGELGIAYINNQDDGLGNVKYEFIAPQGVDIQAEGTTQTVSNLNNGYKKYEFTVNLNNSEISNKVVFKTTVNEREYTLTEKLPGKVAVHNVSESELSGKNLSGVESVVFNEKSMIQLNFAEISEDRYSLILNASYLSDINSNLIKTVFNFYYNPDDEKAKMPFVVSIKYKNKNGLVEELSGNLVKGLNAIEWANLDSKQWTNGAVEKIYFYFGIKDSTEKPAMSDIYFENVVMHEVGK